MDHRPPRLEDRGNLRWTVGVDLSVLRHFELAVEIDVVEKIDASVGTLLEQIAGLPMGMDARDRLQMRADLRIFRRFGLRLRSIQRAEERLPERKRRPGGLVGQFRPTSEVGAAKHPAQVEDTEGERQDQRDAPDPFKRLATAEATPSLPFHGRPPPAARA